MCVCVGGGGSKSLGRNHSGCPTVHVCLEIGDWRLLIVVSLRKSWLSLSVGEFQPCTYVSL